MIGSLLTDSSLFHSSLDLSECHIEEVITTVYLSHFILGPFGSISIALTLGELKLLTLKLFSEGFSHVYGILLKPLILYIALITSCTFLSLGLYSCDLFDFS